MFWWGSFCFTRYLPLWLNCKCYEVLVKMCSLLLMLSFACSKLSVLLFNAHQAKYSNFFFR